MLEQKLLPIARKWSGNIPIWEVRKAGIDPSAVRHWAADNPTVTHPARGMYTWLDPELGFDWEITDIARCVAQGGENAYLWGPSVLELMELGEVGGYYTYVAVPTRRRTQDGIRWIPSADTNISVYRSIPIQPLPDALTASMPMLDPRKQASVLDAVESGYSEYRETVNRLSVQYGFPMV